MDKVVCTLSSGQELIHGETYYIVSNEDEPEKVKVVGFEYDFSLFILAVKREINGSYVGIDPAHFKFLTQEEYEIQSLSDILHKYRGLTPDGMAEKIYKEGWRKK